MDVRSLGLYNGALLVLEGVAGRWWMRNEWPWMMVRRIVTLILILVGWVFFRAQTMTQALGILQRIAGSTSFGMKSMEEALLLATGDSSALPLMAATFLLIVFMFVIEGMQESSRFFFKPSMVQSVRWQAVAVVLLFQAVMLFGVLRASSFIYFQF